MFAFLRRLYSGIILALPGILAMALPFAAARVADRGLDLANLPVNTVINILVALQIIAIAWAFTGWKQNTSLKAELSMGVLAFWLVLITILEPAELQTRDATFFVSRVEAIRQEQHLPLVFYQEKADVMGKVYVVNAARLITPAFIDDLADIAGFPSGLLLVTQEDITAGLQGMDVAANLVATGSMDNASFSAYSITPRYEQPPACCCFFTRRNNKTI